MIQMIPVGKLWQHKDNPRKDLGDLVELTQSIKQSGVMQNLTVVKNYGEITKEWTGGYTVIIGHRRLAAAKIAGLTELPCVVVEMTPEEQVATMLAENMQRVDLTPFEQAQGLQMMFDFGESVESASKKTGLSASTIRRRKKLLDFNADTLKSAVEQGATLADLAELEELEDAEEKNRVLEKFGAPDFRWLLNSALRKQNESKAMQEWREFLENSDAEYREYGLRDLHMISSMYAVSNEPNIDRYTERPLFYSFSGSYINFYRLRCEADNVKDELDAERERKDEERKQKMDRLRELTAIAAATRADFVKNVTEKQASEILFEIALGFIKITMYGVNAYSGKAREKLEETTELNLSEYCGEKMTMLNSSMLAFAKPDEKYKYDCFFENISLIMKRSPAKALFCILMSNLDPYEEKGYFRNYAMYPIYERCVALDEVYRILCLLGYEMTDDEKALQDGTHEIFIDMI